jgi:hypothetical protein
MRIGGWKRVGIIVSLVWILGAGVYTLKAVGDADSEAAAQLTVSCDASLPPNYTQAQYDHCNSLSMDPRKIDAQLSDAWRTAAVVAFVPVPLGWGLTYLALFLVGWVKRGFAKDEHGT